MNKIKIYLHGENLQEPEVLEIESDAPVEDIIVRHREISKGSEKIEEFEIFVEDDDEVKNKKHHCDDAEIHHHTNVHCHRCKSIEVVLQYNGKSKTIHLGPATTGAKLLALLPELFSGMSAKDAADMNLETSTNVLVEESKHIGVLVSYPECKVTISILPKKNVQG